MTLRQTRNSIGGRDFHPQNIGIGVNLRVTSQEDWGCRSHMEDRLAFSHMPTADGSGTCLVYFGVFDGHGGHEAADYAHKNLKDLIMKQRGFWSPRDEDVMGAIRDGFIAAHNGMRLDMDTWEKGKFVPNVSTAGTTASVAFVMRGKIFMGHVGDSRIILGYDDPELTKQYGPTVWGAQQLTKDHKPNSPMELDRITKTGGAVKFKKGVARVVWKRSKINICDGDSSDDDSKGEELEEIPFLAVSRSLGDFWSYNNLTGAYTVSPYPDVSVVKIDVTTHRCLLLASDGVWSVMNSQQAINSVSYATNTSKEGYKTDKTAKDEDSQEMTNPSKRIVTRVKDVWRQKCVRADNISVLTVIIEPPGPAGNELPHVFTVPPKNPKAKTRPDMKSTVLITSKDDSTTTNSLPSLSRVKTRIVNQSSVK